MAQMDSQMKTMRDMHQKMMSAASLEERRQLMADHMKTMKDSMAMMQGMMATRAEHKSAPIPAMMQKQMDMMQMTMQMMMDCMECQRRSKSLKTRRTHFMRPSCHLIGTPDTGEQ